MSRMTVKVHIFQWVAVPSLRIKTGQWLGHLYSDIGNMEELHKAARLLECKPSWFQNHRLLPHYDIWASKLTKAKKMCPVATDEGLYTDMRRWRNARSAQNRRSFQQKE